MHYLDTKGVTKYEFYKNTGISNGVLSQVNGLSEDNQLRFLSYYTDINPAWLLTGKGEMLLGEISQQTEKQEQSQAPQPENTGVIEYLKAEIKELKQENKELIAQCAVLKQENANLKYQIKRNAEGAQGVSMTG